MEPDIPDKVFFKIGEVSRLIDVPEHTLRYWEEEFPQIRPEKTRSGQRLYRRRDIDLLLQVKRLLWEEKFKIAGARRKLRHLSRELQERAEKEKQAVQTQKAVDAELKRVKEVAGQIRHEVNMLLALVTADHSRGVAQSG